MRHRAVTITAFVILTLVNLADVVGMFYVGTPGNPAAEIIPSFALSVIGLAATVPAWRGNRTAALVMFGARAVSTVIGVVYFVVGDQPDWVATGLAIGIVLSIVGLALFVPALRSGQGRAGTTAGTASA